jgi:hypothetical protein
MVDASLDVAYALLRQEQEEDARILALRAANKLLDNDVKVRNGRVKELDKFSEKGGAAVAKKRAEVDEALKAFTKAQAESVKARAGADELALRCAELQTLLKAAAAAGDKADGAGVSKAKRSAADSRALVRDFADKLKGLAKEEEEAAAAVAKAEAAKAAAGDGDIKNARSLEGLADDIEEAQLKLDEALKSIGEGACAPCARACVRARVHVCVRARAS